MVFDGTTPHKSFIFPTTPHWQKEYLDRLDAITKRTFTQGGNDGYSRNEETGIVQFRGQSWLPIQVSDDVTDIVYARGEKYTVEQPENSPHHDGSWILVDGNDEERPGGRG
ncbi:hypothetical protein CS022_24310 [Veronia nyctiphanis]|uniref:Uncharacterized protein n=1 Tax=Veronia nyctiphanis TaxID=1278244 RepID=A0A4Q0YDF1_9GAMM|nr:hypothetical protein [Veronia nyctiphanis]RXJ68055.1 hypothetical protein CS022_24310 [Veronia nyctiphanis]